MGRWTKIALGIAAVLLAAGAAAYAWRGDIALSMMQRTLDRNMATDAVAALPDGLHVGLCGAGSPMPDAARSGPCTLVIAGRRMFVVDAGAGSARMIALMRFQAGGIERLFLTHLHSDHIDGLGELMLQRWIGAANREPLLVHGPTGTDKVVAGFVSAYETDRGFRVAHHGEEVAPPSGFGAVAAVLGTEDEITLIDEPDLKVTAFRVQHEPVEHAVGYRFSYKGRTAVLSGDTRKSDHVARMATGADLLVHEALAPKLVGMIKDAAARGGRTNISRIMNDILSYHTSPEEAAQVAQTAKVKYLLLNHITPPLPLSALEGPFLGGARALFDGPIRVGRDGDFVSLPAGSSEVTVSNRLSTF